MAALACAKRREPVLVAASLDDFPHRLVVHVDKEPDVIEAKLAEMARGPLAPPTVREALLPPEFLPPEPLGKTI